MVIAGELIENLLFKKLISIVLIGRPELKLKLSERNTEVREVVQRCEVVEEMKYLVCHFFSVLFCGKLWQSIFIC